MSPTDAVTTEGLNASLASAPTVMGMSFARASGRARERRVNRELMCMVAACLVLVDMLLMWNEWRRNESGQCKKVLLK